MKHIILLSLIIFLSSCVGNHKNNTDIATNDTISISQLEGEWVMQGYRNALVLDRSPLKAATLLKGYTGICVGKADGDSAIVMVLINNHEAVSGYIYADKYDKESGEFLVINHDLSDTLNLSYNNNGATVKSIKLTYKEKGETVEADQDFDYVAEFKDMNDPCGLVALDVLMAGSWYVNDKDGNELCKITIDDFGNIKGWNGYTLAKIDTDFVLGGEDGLRLSSDNHNNAISYRATFMSDSIKLFESVASEYTPHDKRGKLVYTLARDNK